MGLFDRLRSGLSKTRASITLRLREVVSGRTVIDHELYEDLEEALLEADLGVGPTQRVLEEVARRVREDRVVEVPEVYDIVRDELRRLLGADAVAEPDHPSEGPFVSLIVGVNGVGKTTTIGKLARLHARAGRKVLICAADTFRAAAIEQLEVWAERSGARLVRHKEGSDPAAVVFDALDAADAGGHDVVIVDTAGRLHTKDNLMAELDKIRRVISKRIDGAPHETLLVLDATTGQNALSQARQFSTRVAVTGLVLSKLDGTAKGGIVAAIAAELALPVRYIGVGEGIDDLLAFDAKAFSQAMFE